MAEPDYDGSRIVMLRKDADAMRDRIAALEARERELVALVHRAATESVVTESDEPGCFFCDRITHAEDCPARGM